MANWPNYESGKMWKLLNMKSIEQNGRRKKHGKNQLEL